MKKLEDYIYYHEPGPPDLKIYCWDCLEIMPLIHGGVDLVLTDPPYGINMDKELHGKKGKNGYRDYGDTNWDGAPPDKKIFEMIFKISRDQIIWGGNYFIDKLYPSMGWLVWDKGQRDFSLADGELAWTSFNQALRIKTVHRSQALQDYKQHPTQKSLTIMKWAIQQCKYWDTPLMILDPFLGSGTTLIACKDLKRNGIGIEINPKYCEIAKKRLQNTQVPFL